MDIRKPFGAFPMIVLVSALFMGACGSKQDRARGAFDQYQAAVAEGDIPAARRALQLLVQADDSVADYWLQLGKINLQLGAFGPAYDAFVRAHELDRANAEVLGIMTQLALRTGNLDLAKENAKQLELVAPDNPAVRITYGFVALRRGDLDEATRQADLLLISAPYDSGAKILKSRVMLELGKDEPAIALLREQNLAQPSDQDVLRALTGIYELLDRWPDVAWASRSLLEWRPKDQQVRAKLIESELRSGRVPEALAASTQGLAEASPLESAALLAPWTAVGEQRAIAAEVSRIGSEATGERKIVFARFLAEAGMWNEVIALTRDMATSPVSAANIAANGLHAAAVGQTGDPRAALARLDEALTVDTNQADALRARALLRAKTGNFAGAQEDAKKLVATKREASSSWLLLAAIQRAGKQEDAARRTLWDAFHELPANRVIYRELSDLVTRAEGPQAGQRLAEEFRDQRSDQLTRNLT